MALSFTAMCKDSASLLSFPILRHIVIIIIIKTSTTKMNSQLESYECMQSIVFIKITKVGIITYI